MDVLDEMAKYDEMMETRRREGKNDLYCKHQGSFILVELSDGTVDYFPFGQPPHRSEGGRLVVERDANILEKWVFRGHRWMEE